MSGIWHVLGCGAIGGMLACRWQLAGVDVRVIPREGNSDAYLPLSFGIDGRAFPCKLPQDRTNMLRQVLLTTKAQQGLNALRSIAHRLAPDVTLVVLQNGIGMHEQILEHLSMLCPGLQLVAASTTEGAHRPTPDTILHAGHGVTAVGPWRPQDRSAATAVADLLVNGGLSVVTDEDIRQRLWDKLVMNCAINPLTALLDCRNGDLLQRPGIPQVMEGVVAEVVKVMLAEGLVADLAAHRVKTREVALATATNISSMCTDYRAGRGTEIDFINGEVARRGAARGLYTPLNALLAEAVSKRLPWRDVEIRLASPGSEPLPAAP